ncbi:hypothetical protein HH214_19100 [Mucilaginibacter robiniae]|uniref:DUF4402 domain-containing protein n=1 Tax=Mucilaginibacter robiniae TaxID=2728022 RepID=A0A7L5EA94_9SPHI|nr:hypothetical protein [Mucilaginibacter robiniae]QJD97833.1 hypothetical protein HH214_19100 [Mucilaginibacter robiniae]
MKLLSHKYSFSAIILIASSTLIFQSCGKSADPDPVIVKSGSVTKSNVVVPLNTGANSNGGNSQVPVGSSGTIVFTLNSKTYTLVNNNSTYLVGAAYVEADGGLGISKSTTLLAAGMGNTDIAFSLSTDGVKAGTFSITQISIILADGTSYSMASNSVNKINFTTYVNGTDKVTTQGTFDGVMVNDADNKTTLKISGSFNL